MEQPKGFFKFYKEINLKIFSGYFGVCVAINRALENGIPLTSADYMANIDEKIVKEIFQGDRGFGFLFFIKYKMVKNYKIFEMHFPKLKSSHDVQFPKYLKCQSF